MSGSSATRRPKSSRSSGEGEGVGLVVEAVDGGVAEEPVGEPRGVGQQVLDGHGPVRRDALAAVAQHLDVGELGHELRDGVVERDLAFLDEHHHRDARHRLRHRVDAEDVVPLHRVAGRGVARSHRLPVDDLPPAGHHRHDRREPAVVDVGLHGRPDAGQPLGGHPHRAGARRRQAGVFRRGRLRERGGRERRQRERRDRGEPHERGRVGRILTNHDCLPPLAVDIDSPNRCRARRADRAMASCMGPTAPRAGSPWSTGPAARRPAPGPPARHGRSGGPSAPPRRRG